MCKIKNIKTTDNYFHSIAAEQLDNVDLSDLKNVKSVIIEHCRDFRASELHWGNAFYMSESEGVAKGYMEAEYVGGKLLPQKYFLLKLRFERDIQVIDCLDECYKESPTKDYVSPCLSRMCFELTGKVPSESSPLMQTLGATSVDNGYGVECYHDVDNNRELVIPIKLLNHIEIISIEKYMVNKDGLPIKCVSLEN